MDERQAEGAYSEQVSTGIVGLDDILCGGLDPDCLYLIEGEPGTGKTTLALQFLLDGARQGRKRALRHAIRKRKRASTGGVPARLVA